MRAGRFRPVVAALLVAAVGAVAVLAGAGLAVGGCAGRGDGGTAAPGAIAPGLPPGGPAGGGSASPAPSLLKGVSLSPRSFESDDFADFFVKAGEAGQIVTWAGDWNELSNMVSGAPRVLMELASGYGLLPVIEAQFFSQSTGRLLRPLTAETRKDYDGYAAAFAREFKPPYLGLGIEVNILHEKAPADFDAFVALFGEVYDAVKAESPETKVFTVFQLERMKELGGGLFGGENDPAAAQWALLHRFPKLDLVAFTTHPLLVYKSPADIPADYYSAIRAHTQKPVAFTEVGWSSGTEPAGWESSEAEQAEFARRFFELAAPCGPEMAVWSFMYDVRTVVPFNSMGLRRGDGTARPAWDEWAK